MRPGWTFLLLITCFSSSALGQASIPPPSLSTAGDGRHAGSFAIADQRKSEQQLDPTNKKDDAEIHMALGKLLFVGNDGNHYCSAELVDADVVLTAAHCVVKGKFSSFQFKPDGWTGAPYDTKCIATNPNWVDPGSDDWSNPKVKGVKDPYVNVRFDYAFIKLIAVPTGTKPLAVDFKNKWPVRRNRPLVQKNNSVLGFFTRAVGYPADLSTAVGAQAYTVPAILFLEPYHPNIDVIATKSSKFGRGVSGGAWIVKENSVQTIVSINSSISVSTANNVDKLDLTHPQWGTPTPGLSNYATLYGPILDSDAEKVKKSAAEQDCVLPQ